MYRFLKAISSAVGVVMVSLLISSIFCLSVAYAAEQPVISGKPVVGVYKITSQSAQLSESVVGALSSAIGGLSSVRTMERAKLRQAFSEEILRREGIVTAVRRGHALAPDVDYLIIGEASYTMAPIAGKACRLSLRLVDCSNDIGNVVASFDVYGGTPDGDLSQAIRRAAYAAAQKLAAYWPVQGSVILQNGQVAYISFTAFDNIHKGDKVLIYRNGFKTVNPATGKTITIRGDAMQCKVIEVTQEYSVVGLKDNCRLKGNELVEWKYDPY